jgi:hypothetical protein
MALVSVPSGLLNVTSYAERRIINFTSTDGLVSMVLDVDSAYMLDGAPWLQESNPSNIPFASESPVSLSIFSTVSLCASQVGYWAKAVYDPNLGMLFNGNSESPPSQDPNSPAAKKNGKLSAAAIASIAVFVPVAVGLAVAAVVILIILPKMRSGMPIRQRTH